MLSPNSREIMLKDYKLERIDSVNNPKAYYQYTAIFCYESDYFNMPIDKEEEKQLKIGDSINDFIRVATILDFIPDLREVCNRESCENCHARFICYTERNE